MSEHSFHVGFWNKKDEQILGIHLNHPPSYHKGELIFLEKRDRTNGKEDMDWKPVRFRIKRVVHSIKEEILDNRERTKENPFPFQITYMNSTDVYVKRVRSFRFWMRPKHTIKKNGFWIDLSRTKIKGIIIIEVMWFGMSYS